MLDTLIEPVKEQITTLQKRFPETLAAYCGYSDLEAVLKHATLEPGKWMRSILCFYFANIIAIEAKKSVDSEKLIIAAESIEAIHLASLVHDDIFDEAIVRRDVTCVYKKFGTHTGILSGVYIYSLALQQMTLLNDIEIVKNLGKTVSQLCEGEFRQLNQRHCWDMSVEEYFKIVDQKTAALFASSCFMGAKLMQASPKELQVVSDFGLVFGRLFQLLDDLKDFFDTDNSLKKDPFQDLVMGDVSYPLLLIKSQITQDHWSQLLSAAKEKEFDTCRSLIGDEISQKVYLALRNDLENNIKQLDSFLDQFSESIFKSNLKQLNRYFELMPKS